MVERLEELRDFLYGLLEARDKLKDAFAPSPLPSELKFPVKGTVVVKRGFAKMQKGGVCMDVTNVEQAQIAEEAGHVTIPVMAKCRIGHYMEAKVLEHIGVDMIDESEVLTPADEKHHINKWLFRTPFVNGARNLGEALRRIYEGAAMIRTKGEAGTGNVSEAVKHMKQIMGEIRALRAMNDEELLDAAKNYNVPYELVKETARLGRLPVVNFAAGGIATPADAALMMLLGADGVFVGSGIFKSSDPEVRAQAIVLATSHWDDPEIVVEACRMVSEKKAMMGIDIKTLKPEELLQVRGE